MLVSAAAIAVAASLAAMVPAQAGGSQAQSGGGNPPIVRLVSAQNFKCLQPASLEHAASIIQVTCNGSTLQQWQDISTSGTYVQLRNRASGFCIDAFGGAVNGTPIIQWTCNGISNERWSFGITNNLLASRVAGTASHCLATPGSSDGLAMELRFCDGNIMQKWNRPPG